MDETYAANVMNCIHSNSNKHEKQEKVRKLALQKYVAIQHEYCTLHKSSKSGIQSQVLTFQFFRKYKRREKSFCFCFQSRPEFFIIILLLPDYTLTFQFFLFFFFIFFIFLEHNQQFCVYFNRGTPFFLIRETVKQDYIGMKMKWLDHRVLTLLPPPPFLQRSEGRQKSFE